MVDTRPRCPQDSPQSRAATTQTPSPATGWAERSKAMMGSCRSGVTSGPGALCTLLEVLGAVHGEGSQGQSEGRGLCGDSAGPGLPAALARPPEEPTPSCYQAPAIRSGAVSAGWITGQRFQLPLTGTRSLGEPITDISPCLHADEKPGQMRWPELNTGWVTTLARGGEEDQGPGRSLTEGRPGNEAVLPLERVWACRGAGWGRPYVPVTGMGPGIPDPDPGGGPRGEGATPGASVSDPSLQRRLPATRNGPETWQSTASRAGMTPAIRANLTFLPDPPAPPPAAVAESDGPGYVGRSVPRPCPAPVTLPGAAPSGTRQEG